MKLSAERYGPERGRPLLIAHGLFGSARNWRSVAKALAEDRHVIAVDMRNHGESPWDPVHDYPGMASDLAEVVDGEADVLGHSMGGKAAMHLALTEPGRVARLIVVDVAPMAYDHDFDDLLGAMRDLDPSSLSRRSEADEALAQRIDDPGIRAFLLQSLDMREGRWILNLDVLADRMDDVTGWPGTDGTFEAPTLFVAGGNSDYVARDRRDEIRARFPEARFVEIKGAGHWLHAEKPEAFVTAVGTFLAETDA